jgi:hypothetical protein
VVIQSGNVDVIFCEVLTTVSLGVRKGRQYLFLDVGMPVMGVSF